MSHAAHAAPSLQRLPAYKLALWLAGPIAAIVVASALTAAWLVKYSAGKIEDAQARSETILVRTAFSASVEFAQRAANDYAHWDETYDQFAGQPDLGWAADNLGPNLSESFGTTHAFVFASDGALRYASVPVGGKQTQFLGAAATELAHYQLGELRQAAIDAIKAAQNDHEAVAEGFLSFQGVSAFAAIRPIWPSSESRIATDKPRNALVVLKALDAAQLDALSQSYGLPGLAIGPDFRFALKPLTGGAPKFGARWTSGAQATSFARETVQLLLPLGVAALVLIALTVAGWWRAVGSIRAAELSALEERAKSVQDTARAKSLFVANMSHELRTPLNAIIGFSEVIKEQMLGPLNQPRYVEYAADIHLSGKHLLGIVNNILTLSKIEAQQQRLHIEDVSANEAVTEAVRMIAPDAAKRRVQIETAFDGAPVARADAQALVQIAINLLSNAVKFSPPGQIVRLRVGAQADGVVLSVADNGCGMPPEILAQLGRPFTQAEDPFRRNHQGTGLGLSICFALARQMGGELRIESHEGQGTTGTLTLPGTATAQHAFKPAPRAA